MCDRKDFTVILFVDQSTIFVESSPVLFVAHPNKFIAIGIFIVYAPFNSFVFWISYIHCSYLPITIMANLPIPVLFEHSSLVFEAVVAPMFHAAG